MSMTNGYLREFESLSQAGIENAFAANASRETYGESDPAFQAYLGAAATFIGRGTIGAEVLESREGRAQHSFEEQWQALDSLYRKIGFQDDGREFATEMYVRGGTILAERSGETEMITLKQGERTSLLTRRKYTPHGRQLIHEFALEVSNDHEANNNDFEFLGSTHSSIKGWRKYNGKFGGFKKYIDDLTFSEDPLSLDDLSNTFTDVVQDFQKATVRFMSSEEQYDIAVDAYKRLARQRPALTNNHGNMAQAIVEETGSYFSVAATIVLSAHDF